MINDKIKLKDVYYVSHFLKISYEMMVDLLRRKKYDLKKSITLGKIVVFCLDKLSFINLYAIKMYCLLNLIKNGN